MAKQLLFEDHARAKMLQGIDKLAKAVASTMGPTLNAQLAAADVIDELCLTVSPLLVGGPSGRMLTNGPDHEPRRFAIDRATVAGGLLFTRYLRSSR